MSNAYYDNLPDAQLTIRSRILKIPNLKLISKIGDGGMSTVWQAWDIVNQRVVAVQILNKEFASDGAEIRQVRSEERLMEEIHHPGIVQAYALMRPEGLDGMAVKSLKKKFKDKRFAAKCSRDIIKQGFEMLGMEAGDVMQCCIDGMQAHKEELGF